MRSFISMQALAHHPDTQLAPLASLHLSGPRPKYPEWTRVLAITGRPRNLQAFSISSSACRANHCAPAYQPTSQIGDLLLSPNLLFPSSLSSFSITMLFSSSFFFIPDSVVFSQPSRCAASRNPETDVRDARASEFVPFEFSSE